MKFYFSGIAGKEELSMLRDAGVSRILVDPGSFSWAIDWLVENVVVVEAGGIAQTEFWPAIALDSGAYRAWKDGTEVDVHEYAKYLLCEGGGTTFDFVVAPDVIGDPKKTLCNAKYMWMNNIGCMPVWHWGAPRNILEYYLDEAEVVGIGALVEWMRGKNEVVLRELADLCFQYPQRFHLFGLAWPKAIDRLKDYAYSADSSVWLRGARYAYAIFKHKGHGQLTQAPAKFIPEYKGLDRRGRCVQNAQNIERFCNNGVS